MSDRNFKRERLRQANKLFKHAPSEFKEIDMDKVDHPSWMTRSFRNNRYTVMINDKAKTTIGPALMAMIQMHDDKPIPNHWSEIQNIKNELFGEESVAIEYYPKQSQLTDDHNIYWIWVFHESLIPMPL